ncbi:MAG: isocitrate lyase/phosphoenolpyruvate mutase family protein, partial [Solibacillus isronensis]
LGVLGFDEAIERANAYKEAGAHAIFVEAPTNYEQLSRITKEVPGIPHIINLVEGGKTPLVSRQEAQNLGFQIMLCANSALRGAIKGATDAMQILMRDESQENIHDVICTWEQRQELFKLKEIQQLEKQYS